ncbi:glucose 1-dehydrogenase [Puccinia sorghi]|uniref:Glucose 1-dehydrogenase n=1 Tax=Puccinia sorghi TaxID=27349 RepID=A0A0L6VQN4_9BASI|nr:glucose 1-dehydrogenase [Puccinia sorghi]
MNGRAQFVGRLEKKENHSVPGNPSYRIDGGSLTKGCLVIVADIDGKAAERTVEKIISQSCPDKCPTPIAVQCDVGNEDQVKALVDKAVQAGKRLDVILNKSVLPNSLPSIYLCTALLCPQQALTIK